MEFMKTTVELGSLINTFILNEEWVGFMGDSEYVDSDGKIHFGYWIFKDINPKDSNPMDVWKVTDELEIPVHFDWLFEVENKNGNTCLIEIIYKGD